MMGSHEELYTPLAFNLFDDDAYDAAAAAAGDDDDNDMQHR